MKSYKARLDAAKGRATAAYAESGPLDEETVSEIAEAHSTHDSEHPWLASDLVDLDSDLADFVFLAHMSAEGIPVR